MAPTPPSAKAKVLTMATRPYHLSDLISHPSTLWSPENAKHIPASGPLHMLFLLPGTLFQWETYIYFQIHDSPSSLTSFSSLLKHHLYGEENNSPFTLQYLFFPQHYHLLTICIYLFAYVLSVLPQNISLREKGHI